MPGHIGKLILQIRCASYLRLGLLAVVCSGIILTCVTGSTSDTPLEPSSPIRRLGESEFRLTAKDGQHRPFCFSPDGKRIAGANWDEVRIWSFPDGKLLHDFSDRIDSRCIAFSADGERFLALEQREMTVYHFDVQTGKLTKKVKLADVVDEKGWTRYWLSADGRWLCTTEVYSHVTVWNTETGERQLRMTMQKMVPFHAPVSRQGILTLWDNLFLEQYDIKTGKQLGQSKLYRRLLSPLSNPEGTLMAGYSIEDQAIVFWDPTTNERVGGKIPAKERGWRSNQAALSADGRRFVYWIEDGQWIFNRRKAVFDVETGDAISTFDPPDVYFTDAPVISPDGKYVFPTGGRSVFTPVNSETGQTLKKTSDHVLAVSTLSFTPDGRTLLVGSRDKRQAWDIATGKSRAVFEQWYHTPCIAAVDNNRALVSGLRHGGLRLHDISTGEVLQQYMENTDKHLSAFQLAKNGNSFVGIVHEPEGRFVRRWGIGNGKTIAEWAIPDVAQERSAYAPNTFGGLTLGGSRLYRFDQVQAPQKLPDDSFDWGRTDLLLVDWSTQEVASRLSLPAHSHFAINNTKDCSKLAVVAADEWHPKNQRGYGPGSTYLLIWDMETGEEQLRVERVRDDYFSSFSGVAISPGGRLAATASHHSRIEIWNGFTGKLLQRLDAKNPIVVLAFSYDGFKLASGHQDGSVYLWDTRPAWELSSPEAR